MSKLVAAVIGAIGFGLVMLVVDYFLMPPSGSFKTPILYGLGIISFIGSGMAIGMKVALRKK